MNKRVAFKRMAETREFKLWIKMETARITGIEAEIERKVNRAMLPKNLRVEVKEGETWKEEE